MKKQSRKATLRALALLIAACGAHSLGFAAEAQESTSFEVSQDLQDYTIESDEREIIVTASRTEMEVKDSPNSVQVINRTEIENSKAQNLQDLLRSTLGVTVSEDGMGGNSIMIRGFDATRVVLLIDGRRISVDPGSPNQRELARMRMDDVERVEIVKGPGSAMYGSDAMGGVINVITRAPKEDRVEVSYEKRIYQDYGSAGEDIGVYFSAKQRGSFSWTLSAGQNYRDELELEKGVSEKNYGKEIPISFKGIWQLPNDGKIQADIRYRKEEMKSDNSPKKTYYDNDRWDYSLEYTGKNEKMDWQLRAYYSFYDKNYDVYQGSKHSSFDKTKRKIATIEGKTSILLGEEHKLTTGFDITRDEVEGTRIFGKGKPITSDGLTGFLAKQSITKYAAYIQDEWAPSDKWLVIPALRLESTDEFGTEVTPKIGATYFYRPDLRVKMSYAQGYRIPSMTELYHDFRMGTTQMVGNPDLDPEKSQSYEIAVEKDWKKHSVKAAYFYNDVDDLISRYQFKKVGPIKYNTYRNVDNAEIQGVEISSEHKIAESWSMNLGYSYLKAIDKDTKQRLEERPSHQYVIGVRYQKKNSPWSVGLDGNYLQDYIYDATENQKNFFVANLIAEYSFGKNSNIYFGIDNLFGKKDPDMYLYGQTYRMGATYRF